LYLLGDGDVHCWNGAGTGKTYLAVALVTKLRSLYKLPLPIATSGIAATNYVHGMTAHRALKIPIPILPHDTLRVPLQSLLANALRFAACIVWDELPNTDNLNVLATDRSLRQILQSDSVFMGGKPFAIAPNDC
jgi:hypothetical protein